MRLMRDRKGEINAGVESRRVTPDQRGSERETERRLRVGGRGAILAVLGTGSHTSS
jgi:hypothetical protein